MRGARTPRAGVGSGYRYYSSELGRWLSRDPIGEEGGANVFAFSLNGGLTYVDAFGLEITSFEIRHAGPPLLSGGEYANRVVRYFTSLVGGDLGLHTERHPGFTERLRSSIGGSYDEHHPPARAVAFKFEYVATSLCPPEAEKDIRISQWILPGSGMWWRVRGSGGTWSLDRDWRRDVPSLPHRDGPDLQRVVATAEQDAGRVLTTYAAGDAPRWALEERRGLMRREYWVRLIFRVRVEDADSAWEAVHRINIFFDMDGARGRAQITTAPHRVAR